MGPICAIFISELKHRSLNTIEVSFNITRPIKSMNKNIITMTIFNMTLIVITFMIIGMNLCLNTFTYNIR